LGVIYNPTVISTGSNARFYVQIQLRNCLRARSVSLRLSPHSGFPANAVRHRIAAQEMVTLLLPLPNLVLSPVEARSLMVLNAELNDVISGKNLDSGEGETDADLFAVLTKHPL